SDREKPSPATAKNGHSEDLFSLSPGKSRVTEKTSQKSPSNGASESTVYSVAEEVETAPLLPGETLIAHCSYCGKADIGTVWGELCYLSVADRERREKRLHARATEAREDISDEERARWANGGGRSTAPSAEDPEADRMAGEKRAGIQDEADQPDDDLAFDED